MQNIEQVNTLCQESGPSPKTLSNPLDCLIADLGWLRDGMIAKDRKRRSAVLAGQLRILASAYRDGSRPRHRDLKRFFYFVTREAA